MGSGLLLRRSFVAEAGVASALFARLPSFASRSIARRLPGEREALILFPAFGAFLGIVSASVVSHKPDLRPLVPGEQRERMR
jgi:hypothetical protein